MNRRCGLVQRSHFSSLPSVLQEPFMPPLISSKSLNWSVPEDPTHRSDETLKFKCGGVVEGGYDVTTRGPTLGEDRQPRTTAVSDASEWQTSADNETRSNTREEIPSSDEITPLECETSRCTRTEPESRENSDIRETVKTVDDSHVTSEEIEYQLSDHTEVLILELSNALLAHCEDIQLCPRLKNLFTLPSAPLLYERKQEHFEQKETQS